MYSKISCIELSNSPVNGLTNPSPVRGWIPNETVLALIEGAVLAALEKSMALSLVDFSFKIKIPFSAASTSSRFRLTVIV